MIEPSTSSGYSPTPCNDRPGTMTGNGSPESTRPQEDDTDDSLASLLARGVELQRELPISPPTSNDVMFLPPQLNGPVPSSSSSFLVDIIQEALDLIGENDLDQAGGRSEYFCSGAGTRKGSSLPQ